LIDPTIRNDGAAMINAKRIGHATFETPDVERQIAYYVETVGLVVANREPNRAYLASPLGQLAIVLEKGAQQRCTRLSFEVARDLDATELTRRLSGLGLRGEPCGDPLPGVSRLVTFADPKGTVIELFSEWNFLDVKPSTVASAPLKLGHVAFYHPDPQAIAEFYAKTLGFRVSDWIGDFFVFMRCGVDHHTINFLRAERTTMQHMAFELRDAHHLHGSCDLLARQRIPIAWGPVRHGPGHNIAVYHRNPDDQIIELFCELDRVADEELGYFEPRPWHRDRPQKPKVWDPTPPRDLWGLPPSPEFLRPSK
jgi:catechol 2,3-dioxygenase-like lactoylglutathione lyase family enzyme